MAYDGMYGDLSTRGTANQILDQILQVQDEVEVTQDEIDVTAQAVAAQVEQSALNADEAATYRDQAAGYSDAAQTSSIQASGYASTASGASVEAMDSAAAALVSETNAAASETAAQTAEVNAEKWATNPEDVEVEPGLFSSMHWAIKSQEAAQIPIDITGPRLTSIATLSMNNNDILVANSDATMRASPSGATGRAVLTAADASAARSIIGLNATSVTSLTALTMATQNVPYFNSSSSWSQVASTSYGRSLWNAADAAAARTLVGLNATSITSLGALTMATQNVPYFNSSSSWSQAASTAYGRSLWNAADAAGARTTLGSTSIGDALFTAASAAAARTTLGSTSTGDALFTAASAATARTTIGALTAGDYGLGSGGATHSGAMSDIVTSSLFQYTENDPTEWGSANGDFPMGVNFYRSSLVRSQFALSWGSGSGAYYRVSNGVGNIASATWLKLLERADINGPVSQSGGVATGAIIEYGNNANGDFVKFADGTLICTTRTSRALSFVNSSNLNFVWTYPAAFVGASPSVSVNLVGSTLPTQKQITAVAAYTRNTSSATCAVLSVAAFVSGDVTGMSIDGLAVGRWF